VFSQSYLYVINITERIRLVHGRLVTARLAQLETCLVTVSHVSTHQWATKSDVLWTCKIIPSTLPLQSP